MAAEEMDPELTADRYVDVVSVKKNGDGSVTLSTDYWVRTGGTVVKRPLRIPFTPPEDSPKRAWEIVFAAANADLAGLLAYTPPGLPPPES